MNKDSEKEKAQVSSVEKDEKSGRGSTHPPTIIFGGFARLPANAAHMYASGVLAVELEVDPYDMKVVDAACNCLPALGQKFLIGILVGKKLDDGLEHAIKEIRARYFSTAQRAMIAALEDVLRNYKEFWQGKKTKDKITISG